MKILQMLIILSISFSIGCSSTKNKTESIPNEKIEPIVLDVTNDGMIIGINKDNLHYIFKIKSNEQKWKNFGSSYVFLVDDNTALQVLTLSFGLNNKIQKNMTEIDILKDNMKYELDYQEKQSGMKLKSSSEVVQLNGQKALYWKTESPEKNGGTQLYLTLIKKNNYLISFNSPLNTNREKDLKKLLIETANTIKIIDNPITTKFMFEYNK